MTDIVIHFGAVIAAVTTIIAFSIKLYDKLVAEPDRKVEEKIQREQNRSLEKSIMPLTQSIERLNHLLEESEKDREDLHQRDYEQGVVLDNHETRISVLEDWRKRRNN